MLCAVYDVTRWWLLPPQKTHLFLDRYGQLPSDFLAEHVAGGDCETSAPSADAADAAVAALRAEGRRHLLELVQVRGQSVVQHGVWRDGSWVLSIFCWCMCTH